MKYGDRVSLTKEEVNAVKHKYPKHFSYFDIEAREVVDNESNYRKKYYKYIQTTHWNILRHSKLNEKKIKECEKCGCRSSLDVHHLRYKKLYDVETSDLMILCRSCHKKEHDKRERR